MPPKEISPQLAARLGPTLASYDDRPYGAPPPPPPPAGGRGRGGRGGGAGGAGGGSSDYARLRGIIRQQKEKIWALEHEVGIFRSRLGHVDEGHRLERARLKKEIEYHKRLRQGADQRSYELENRLLRQQQRNTAVASDDVEKQGLIEQSQLLISKNSELQYKLQAVRVHNFCVCIFTFLLLTIC